MSPARRRRPRRIPAATYRLQLHRDFPFTAAREVVPYLARLGVSDCYLSPIFAARPGSTHGYDVTDHNRINEELGGPAEYGRLSEEISARGMGQVLDIVPNHMGIDAASNPWWHEVLENGQCSAYSPFFDIDWAPLKPELHSRVLLPILGRQYGHALEAGEIQAVFEDGRFLIRYGDHRLPINPRQCPRILRIGIEGLQRELGADDADARELMSVISALSNMPPHTESSPDAVAERKREKEVQRERLGRLAEGSSRIRRHIEDALRQFNGTPEQAATFDSLHELLEAQPYRLAYWRTASHEINYRRFFDINDLAGLRQEQPQVFQSTHALVAELLATGRITGLRVDHPDGLFDPRGYFDQLQALASRVWQQDGDDRQELYVVAEKILSGDERLPDEWPVHGTTGYNFLNDLNGLFVDPASARRIRRVYARFTGSIDTFDEIVHDSKRLIMDTSLASELNVLANAMDRIGESDRRSRDFTMISLREALGEIVACFPVYRTYVREDGWTVRDREVVDHAVECARRRNPALEPIVFDFLREVLLPRRPEDEPFDAGAPVSDERRKGYPPTDAGDRQRRLRASMKLQQYTAPVQAKGFEDTTFYRYNALLSLNEVGGEPAQFGRGPALFHQRNAYRRERWPYEMLCTSTHDTKLGEDVRARINAISELPEEWSREITRWKRLNQSHRTLMGSGRRRSAASAGDVAPDRNDEYRFYQALVGAWPAEAPDHAPADLVDRLKAFMMKSIKEAKVHTSWINENRRYDDAVAKFVERTLTGAGGARFLPAFLPFQRRVAAVGVVNSLAQLVLKAAGPGVPDFYQGTERWNLSLVDPDNRRPVDFALNARMLDEVDAMLASDDVAARARDIRDMYGRCADGRIKLCLTAAALRARRDHPETFLEGEYVPLPAESTVPAGIVAFARVPSSGPAVLAIAPRLVARLMAADNIPPLGEAWKTSRILLTDSLSGRRFRDVLTWRELQITRGSDQSWIFAGQVFESCPVALLIEV